MSPTTPHSPHPLVSHPNPQCPEGAAVTGAAVGKAFQMKTAVVGAHSALLFTVGTHLVTYALLHFLHGFPVPTFHSMNRREGAQRALQSTGSSLSYCMDQHIPMTVHSEICSDISVALVLLPPHRTTNFPSAPSSSVGTLGDRRSHGSMGSCCCCCWLVAIIDTFLSPTVVCTVFFFYGQTLEDADRLFNSQRWAICPSAGSHGAAKVHGDLAAAAECTLVFYDVECVLLIWQTSLNHHPLFSPPSDVRLSREKGM